MAKKTIKNTEVHSEENAQTEIGGQTSETENSNLTEDLRSPEEKEIIIEIEKLHAEIMAYEFKIDTKSTTDNRHFLNYKCNEAVDKSLELIATGNLPENIIHKLVNVIYDIQDKLSGRNKFVNFLELTKISNVNIWKFIPNRYKGYLQQKYKPYSLSHIDQTLKKILSEFTVDYNSYIKTFYGAHFYKDNIVVTDGHILLKIKGDVKEEGRFCLTKLCIDNEKEFLAEMVPNFDEVIPMTQPIRHYMGLIGLAEYTRTLINSYLTPSGTNTVIVKYGNSDDGSPLFIGFNSELLMIAIDSIYKLTPDEKFDIGFSTPSRVITIKTHIDKITILLMPLIINDIDSNLYYDLESGKIINNGFEVGISEQYSAPEIESISDEIIKEEQALADTDLEELKGSFEEPIIEEEKPFKQEDIAIQSDLDYFKEKLSAIKIAKKFADKEEKTYFLEMEASIKIALKYL